MYNDDISSSIVVVRVRKNIAEKTMERIKERGILVEVIIAHLLIETGGLNNAGCDNVRIDVGGGAAVFEIALALRSAGRRNTDGRTTVSNTRAELGDGGGLVLASETEGVVLAIHGNVFGVLLGQLLDGGIDFLQATVLAHGLGAVVGVASSTVPVTLSDGLGVEGNNDAKSLSDSVHEVTGKPEVVTDGDAKARANLELPLTGHDLRIDTSDLHASIQAGSVVGLNEGAAEDLIGANTAVIGTLRGRVASLRPAEGGAIECEKGVLLLKAEPGLLGLGLLHDNVGRMAGVGGQRGSVGFICVADDQDVITTTERVTENCASLQDDLAVVSGGLTSARTVIVPFRQL